MVTKKKQRRRRIAKAKPALILKVSGGDFACNFFTGSTLDQLVRMQAVEPLKDSKALAAGWPEDEDIDDVLQEIYEDRH